MTTAFETSAPVVKQSLGEVVYERLLSAILSGNLVGGDELSEVTLAEQFEVSRTPVREALNRLSIDGLIDNGRNRRATVRTVNRDLVVEIYQVRQCLESWAARWATGKLTTEDWQRLDAMAATARPTPEHTWQEAAIRFDSELHATIASRCGNVRLANEIRRYSNFVPIFQRLAGKRDDRLQLAYEQHLEILDALRRGDAEAAASAMANHVAAALQVLVEDVFPSV